MAKISFRYRDKCCGICANFDGPNAILKKDTAHYYVESSVKGKCRFKAGSTVTAVRKPVCSNFDPLPGYNE